ncbi:MAG: insulinase family protein [Spirochaetaceae bacterium]|nr:insulinase family protein [Spirochaetaceae bacterium]
MPQTAVAAVPTTAVAVPATSYAVERSTLANGLRVVVTPDRSSPVVAVAVYYDVGIRSEPEGRTGFAHLFEHLMFQGSASLQKMEHVKYVQASGGTLNGSTRMDYTNYYEALPSHALERALFLEADRMHSPRVTEENLANQIAVVKEEIRVNVLNQPYGGFPWLTLPPVLFDTFPNAHNGYGGFEDLESATVADAQDFFDRYYAPGNAVLAIGGDLDVAEAMALVERHFGDVPSRAVPPRPDFDEAPPATERRAEQVDPQAPAPAVALGWRVPDPADLDAYLPFVVLTSALTTGDASRLRRRLVHEDRLATDVGSHLGLMEDPFDVRNPTALILEAHHGADVTGDRVVTAVDEELDRLATDGLDTGELERVQARLGSALVQGQDHVLGRVLSMAVFEQQRGRAELVGELPALLGEVDGGQVQAAAAALRPQSRARLDVVAGGR